MATINFPDSPTDGEQYVPSNGVLYTYSAADDSWTGRTFVRTSVDPAPADVTATPDFVSGTGDADDPFIITPETVALGGSVNSDQQISIANQAVNQFIRFNNNTTPDSVKPKFNQSIQLTNSQGEWDGVLKYNDSEGITTSSESTYVGLLNIGTVYISWTITQQV